MAEEEDIVVTSAAAIIAAVAAKKTAKKTAIVLGASLDAAYRPQFGTTQQTKCVRFRIISFSSSFVCHNFD